MYLNQAFLVRQGLQIKKLTHQPRRLGFLIKMTTQYLNIKDSLYVPSDGLKRFNLTDQYFQEILRTRVNCFYPERSKCCLSGTIKFENTTFQALSNNLSRFVLGTTSIMTMVLVLGHSLVNVF